MAKKLRERDRGAHTCGVPRAISARRRWSQPIGNLLALMIAPFTTYLSREIELWRWRRACARRRPAPPRDPREPILEPSKNALRLKRHPRTVRALAAGTPARPAAESRMTPAQGNLFSGTVAGR